MEHAFCRGLTQNIREECSPYHIGLRKEHKVILKNLWTTLLTILWESSNMRG